MQELASNEICQYNYIKTQIINKLGGYIMCYYGN